MIFVKLLFDFFSQTTAQILTKFGSRMHLSKVTNLFKSRLYDLFSPNYGNELLGSYVTCIFTMYYYMSLCNIPFLTSLELLHGFASNFVWMSLGWTPTKFVNIGVLHPFSRELWVILWKIWLIVFDMSAIIMFSHYESYRLFLLHGNGHLHLLL